MRATFHVDGVLAFALLTVWSVVASVRDRFLSPPPLAPFPVPAPGHEPGPAQEDPWRWN